MNKAMSSEIRSTGCKSVSYVKIRVKSIFNLILFVYIQRGVNDGDIYRRNLGFDKKILFEVKDGLRQGESNYLNI